MKLKLRVKKKKSRAGRPSEGFDSIKFNFWADSDLVTLMDSTKRRMFDLGIKKPKLTKSYVFREGSMMLLRKLQADMDKATNGEYHAKKRDTLKPKGRLGKR